MSQEKYSTSSSTIPTSDEVSFTGGFKASRAELRRWGAEFTSEGWTEVMGPATLDPTPGYEMHHAKKGISQAAQPFTPGSTAIAHYSPAETTLTIPQNRV